MSGKLRLLKIFLILCICFSTSSCNKNNHSNNSQTTSRAQSIKNLIVPSGHAYSGAYIDFGDFEDDVTLEGIESFDKLAGRTQAIIAFSSIWSRQSFPAKQTRIVGAYGAIPLIYWSPWGNPGSHSSPLGEELKKDSDKKNYSLTDIIAGTYDAYIDDWATQAKNYQDPMFVAFGIEMNGDWFPWSGFFYGAGKQIESSSPKESDPKEINPKEIHSVRYLGPETFIKAYRHIVDRVRAKGASNIIWVFHANNTSSPSEPWNRMANYWPGSNYVDWIALSAYGKQYQGEGWPTFDEAFPDYYKEICKLDPDKPFMLAEWGVGEFPANGNKGAWISEAFQKLSSQYPRLHGSVYWNERWQNDNLSYSNIRINSSLEALTAYRNGLANPFWLDRPIYEVK